LRRFARINSVNVGIEYAIDGPENSFVAAI
jgi:hypothetical protein